MLLNKMRLQGFQSFKDTGELKFSRGMNLIIGQNNVGKSALLRSLVWPLQDDRHRSSERWQTHRLPQPVLQIQVDISGEELMDQVFVNGGLSTAVRDQTNLAVQHIFDQLFSGNHQFPLKRTPNQEIVERDPPHGLFAADNNRLDYQNVVFQSAEGELKIAGVSFGSADQLPTVVRNIYDKNLFYFSAQRLTVGRHQHARAVRLLPNASNLPAVLHTLAGSRGSIFREIVDHTKSVFPGTVGNISISPVENEMANEIRIWPTEAQDEIELSFALEDSGTGVSQVIAILTAVATAAKSVIVIDEINSFMHPSAVKTLLRILETYYAGHQYIISTHSPEVISFGTPGSVHMVTREGYNSSVCTIDLSDVNQLQGMADHLGISMSDVFAAERIIWVEGPTEEICFPYILEKIGASLPGGTAMISVVATGDFGSNQRNKKLVYDIYKRLTSATKSLVKGVAFSFDSEGLSARQKSDMSREAEGAVFFLPRRLFECYLIDAEAITAFLHEKDSLSINVSSSDVLSKIMLVGNEYAPSKFNWNGSIDDEDWLSVVDGAKLINRVVSDLSQQRLIFRKKGDAFTILKHIMANNPGRLLSLANHLKTVVQAVGG